MLFIFLRGFRLLLCPFISAWRIPFSISRRAGLVAANAVRFFVFKSESDLISPSLLKDGFAGYRFRRWPVSFSALKVSPSSPAWFLMRNQLFRSPRIPSVLGCSSPVQDSLASDSLTIKFLGGDLWVYPSAFVELLGWVGPYFSPNLGSLGPLFLQILFPSPSSPPSCTRIICMLWCLMLSHRSLGLFLANSTAFCFLHWIVSISPALLPRWGYWALLVNF